MKNTKNTAERGPGRPAYAVKYPYGKFTFNQLCELNGVSTKGVNKGKGKNCTALTLRKALDRDMFHVDAKDSTKVDKTKPRRNSEIVLVKNETREPNSNEGLGRKAFVYIRRAKLAALKSASKSSVNVPLNDTPAPAVTSPADTFAQVKADIAASATAPAPAPAPVATAEAAEVTAPVAPVETPAVTA